MSCSPELPAELAGRFECLRELGGAEGRTLLVRDAGGTECVLKLVPGGIRPQEASLLQALPHPAISALLETGVTTGGMTWILRQFVAGTPLSRAAPPGAEDLVQLAGEMLELLGYVHQRGVLHLDLKPDNILRRPDGAPTRHALLDFGLGARGPQAAQRGTPLFAAPEQHLGMTVDARTDLYGLGATILLLLRPDARPLSGFTSRLLRDGLPAALGIVVGSLPPPFPRLLPRLLACEMAHRFADAQEALEVLAGAGGRPSRSLLAPDPVHLFGTWLEAQLAGAPPGASLLLGGGAAGDRLQLGLHALATDPDILGIETQTGHVLLRRADTASVEVCIPPLDAGRIATHLRQCVGLAAEAAAATAVRLSGVSEMAALAEQLQQLADQGEIVPDGMRWSWPAAAAGRFEWTPARLPAEPEAVAAAAAGGRPGAAIRAWREAAAAMHAGAEQRLRHALADGLLLGGEPAQALVLVHDEPLLRARALLDLGRVADAAQALTHAGADAPRRGQVAAAVAFHLGDIEQALRLSAGATSPETLVLRAGVLIGAGDLEPARALLRHLLARLEPGERPYLRAAALTNLAMVERSAGNPAAAREALLEAAALHRRLGHVRHTATVLMNLGVVAKDLGEHEAARQHQRQARAMLRHVGDDIGTATADANLGLLALAEGNPGEALSRLQRVLARLTGSGAGQLLTRIHAAIAAAETALAGTGSTPAPTSSDDAAVTSEPHDRGGVPLEVFRTFVAVNRRLAGEADLGKAMAALLDAAVTLTGGRHGLLLLARPDGLRLEFHSGEATTGASFSRSMVQRAMQGGRILTAEDALADRDLIEMASVRDLRVRSAICVPFRSAGGATGALYIEHPGRTGAFGEREKQHLEVLADQAAIAVDRMLQEEQLQQDLARSKRQLAIADRSLRRRNDELVGNSAAMRKLRAQIDRLGRADLPILIRGETGTGKELVARAIHRRSARHRGPFVPENCAAIPAELIESELFGVVRGAFTGADQDRAGLLELASGGTLFLDEVGDMPMEMQSKLLRALQEQAVRRVGGSELIPIDCRLVAATHRDLRERIQAGAFREDLYFRIAAAELPVPPLRERGDDVVALAGHFLARLNREQRRDLRFGDSARAALRAHHWPGNVRELEHAIARGFLLSDGNELVIEVAPARAPTREAARPPTPVTLMEAERAAILAAIAATNGDKTAAAKLLGISRTALYDKLKRHGGA